MKALTLHQPWASAIAVGSKRIENRTWLASRFGLRAGDTFAIHAGLAYNEAAGHTGGDDVWPQSVLLHARAHRGAVVAVARLVACGVGAGHTERIVSGIHGPDQFAHWFIGPVGWVLDGVVALPEPVPCKGRQGVWTLPDDVAELVLAQVAREGGDRG